MSRIHFSLSRVADVAHRVVNGSLVFGTLAMIGGLGYGAYSLYVLRPAYLNSIRNELEEKAAAKHGISVEEVRQRVADGDVALATETDMIQEAKRRQAAQMEAAENGSRSDSRQ